MTDPYIRWRDGTTGELHSCLESEIVFQPVPLKSITEPIAVRSCVRLSKLADPACLDDYEPLFREALALAQTASGPFSMLDWPVVEVSAEDLRAMGVL